MVDDKVDGWIGVILGMLVGACGDNAAPPLALPVLYEGNVWGDQLAVADGQVYFVTFYHGPERDQAVWRVGVEGGEPALLWHGAPGATFGHKMTVQAEDLFFDQDHLEDADDRLKLFSVPIGGGERRDWGFAGGAGGLVVDDHWLYVGNPDGLTRVPRGGGTAEVLAAGYIGDVERAGDEVYITRGDRLERVDVEAGVVTPITGVAGIGRLTLTTTDALAIAGDAVVRMPLPPSTATPATVLSGHGAPYEIAADGDDLYAVVEPERDGARLLHVSLSTGAVVDITPKEIRPGRLVVDADSVFLAFCCGGTGTGGGQVLRVAR